MDVITVQRSVAGPLWWRGCSQSGRDGPKNKDRWGGARLGDSVASVNVTFFSSHHLRYRFRARSRAALGIVTGVK